MPIYEYDCKSCGTRFDKMQPITAEPLVVCLNCGQGPIRRVYHPVGVIFKGSGWYITDNRNSGKQDTSSTASKPDAGEGGAKESSGDSTSKPSDTPAPASATDD